MRPGQGTPKTLLRAIANGIERAGVIGMLPEESTALAEEVLPHIKDFLAQKFSTAYLTHPDCVHQMSILFKALTAPGDHEPTNKLAPREALKFLEMLSTKAGLYHFHNLYFEDHIIPPEMDFYSLKRWMREELYKEIDNGKT